MQNRKFHAWREAKSRVYTLCSFEPHLIVPEVQLIEAATDDEAMACARARALCNLRELWDHHRLVAVIQPKHSLPARPSAKVFAGILAGYPHAISAPGAAGQAVLSKGIRDTDGQ